MRNNIKEGDKLIAIDKCKMNSSNRKALTIGKEYEHKGYYNIDSVIIHSDINKNHLFKVNNLSKFFKIKDEWKPTQGNKVLWSDVKSKDKIGIFICEYENYFIVKHTGNDYDLENGTLRYATNIKPYEDEIKVGDWVHNSDGHVLKCKYLGLNNNPNWIKITNQDLIDKLNKL